MNVSSSVSQNIKFKLPYGGEFVAPSWEVAEILADRLGDDFPVVSLGDVDLRGVLFYNIDFSKTDFAGADSSRTIFCECVFGNNVIWGVKEMVGAKFVNVVFSNSAVDVFFESINMYGRLVEDYKRNRIGNGYTCYATVIGPDDVQGEFVGYKYLVSSYDAGAKLLIAKLRIPADAQRVVFHGLKCRASKAIVEEMYDMETRERWYFGCGPFSEVEYYLGETVEADSFDNSFKECTHGIHFFLTEQEAVDYAKCQY